MTGYPADLLDPDLDLEADLGVDTVKQAEVFAAVRAHWNLERDDTLQLREFPTLNHVAGWVRGKLGVPEPTAAPHPRSAPASPARRPPRTAAPRQRPTRSSTTVTGDRRRDDRLPRRPARPRPRPRGRPRRRHRQAGRGLRRRPRPLEPRARRHPPAARVPHPQPRRRLGARQARRAGAEARPTAHQAGRRGPRPRPRPTPPRTPSSATSTRWTRSPGGSPRPRCARPPTGACRPGCRSRDARVVVMRDEGGVGDALVKRLRKAGATALWCSTPARPPTRCSRSWPRGPPKARSPASTGSPPSTTRATSRHYDLDDLARGPAPPGQGALRRRCATSGRPTPFLVSATRLGGYHGYDGRLARHPRWAGR